MRKIIFWIINAIIFLLLFIFAFKNQDSVTLKFINMQWDMPLIILILIVFAIGCFFGILAMLPFIWNQRKKGKKAIQQARETSSLVKVD
ncbi:MAG: LapA family protein [Saezia sp.]